MRAVIIPSSLQLQVLCPLEMAAPVLFVLLSRKETTKLRSFKRTQTWKQTDHGSSDSCVVWQGEEMIESHARPEFPAPFDQKDVVSQCLEFGAQGHLFLHLRMDGVKASFILWQVEQVKASLIMWQVEQVKASFVIWQVEQVKASSSYGKWNGWRHLYDTTSGIGEGIFISAAAAGT